ncbi:MAG: glycine cleavage system aminomethyltransferase GcvT, partial [Gemmatimonadota bacterium]
MTTTSAALKRTEFYEIHKSLGAKIVPFAGYEMPVQYPTGINAEHKAVRTECGLFDVSHMGEFIIRGPQAVDFVNRVTTNDVSALKVGQAHYSAILTDQGTFVDDCLVYRYADHLMMVVNASNKDKDFAHIEAQRSGFNATLEDISDSVALLALQGPKAQEILAPLTSVDLDAIEYYHFAVGAVAGVPDVTISRTGYTGEDGFELYFAGSQADVIWNALTKGGNVTPAGLGARDTLRLEMGMALYGNDIDDTVTPLEANLAWITKLQKGEFTGRGALVKQKADGVKKKLVCFTLVDRAIAR